MLQRKGVFWLVCVNNIASTTFCYILMWSKMISLVETDYWKIKQSHLRFFLHNLLTYTCLYILLPQHPCVFAWLSHWQLCCNIEWYSVVGKFSPFIFVSIYIGSQAYEKLCSALNNIHLMKGIKQASPLAQTSCLGGFILFWITLPQRWLPSLMLECTAGMIMFWFSRHYPFVTEFFKLSEWK